MTTLQATKNTRLVGIRSLIGRLGSDDLVVLLSWVGIALILLAAARSHSAPGFVVIQINDVYRIDAVENGKLGGLGRVASLVRQAQNENPSVFIFHAGDFLSPSLETEYFKGQQMVDAMNFLGGLVGGGAGGSGPGGGSPEGGGATVGMYVVPGNHEFDSKSSLVADAIKGSTNFTWLSSNIDFTPKSSNDPQLARFPEQRQVVTMGGMKVGIFAITIFDNYGPSDSRWPAVNKDYTGVAEEEITKLENEGAEIIIGLTHLDVDDDKKLATLRSRHPKFMWIAGGHEHTSQKYDLTQQQALITKSDSNARSVWRVRFGRTNRAPSVTAEKVELDESIHVDADYKASIEDPYRARLKQKIPNLDDVVGTMTTCVDGREETVRNQESNLGNYIADQMRLAFTGADAAFFNSGTLRLDDRVCDELRVEHLKRTLGFPAPIALITITGEQLHRALENAITRKSGEGRFLQVSGIRFEFDRAKDDGRRVSNVWINQKGDWNPLARDKTEYTLVVPEYIFCGGDGYSFQGTKAMKEAGECEDGRLTGRDKLPDLRDVFEKAVVRAHSTGKPITAFYEMRVVDKTR